MLYVWVNRGRIAHVQPQMAGFWGHAGTAGRQLKARVHSVLSLEANLKRFANSADKQLVYA